MSRYLWSDNKRVCSCHGHVEQIPIKMPGCGMHLGISWANSHMRHRCEGACC